MLELEFAQLSDPGRMREHNEDYLGHAVADSPARARTHGWLFVVADGVGGNDDGEVASRLAVGTLLAGFQSALSGEPHASLLQRLVQAANVNVHEAGLASGSAGRAMATTVVAVALRFDRITVAHVGDSRCYLIRRGNAVRLTRDHTLASEQVRLGILSSEQANGSTSRHVLSRSLGNELFVSADVSEHLLLPGDVLLLSTDGLHGAVLEADLAKAVNEKTDLQATAQHLVQLANERDGSDNVSLQLVRICDVERVGMYRGRPYKLP
ncbi:MAG: protein phosphatase 2C domain-containing protein [Candidatus Korobacteraceae bacterium]|jgi:protein phosphatase